MDNLVLAQLDPFSWFLIYMAISVATAYTIDQMAKKEKVPSRKPDELTMPDIEEGHTYGILFGTAMIENSFVAWWGNVTTTAIRRKVGKKIDWKWGLPGHGSLYNSVYATVGYHYDVGVHFKLCQGQIDGIKQIRVTDVVVWPTPGDAAVLQADGASSASIDYVNAFGGEDNEGGVVGTVDFEYGDAAQTPNSYLTGILGSNISAARGLLGVVLKGVRVGTSPYFKPWKFLCKRTDILTDGSPQWYLAKAEIGTGTLNAAHIIRECMTNTEWGFGNSTGLFDDAVWEAVADDLYTEGFGLCRKWESADETLEEFIKDILRHITAVLYQEPTTGKFIIKLIRDDYNVGDLDTYDESSILSVANARRGAVGTVPDMIWVDYWNIIDHKSESVPDHDIALMDLQGGKSIPLHVEYFGITQPALAGKVAARDRQVVTAFPMSSKIKGNRTMSAIRPGDVFKLDWPLLGITAMVVRVLDVDFGTLKHGEMIFHCVQDVFSMQTALYSAPPGTGWSTPYNDPIADTARKLTEVPFWDVIGPEGAGLADVQALDNDAGFLMVSVRQPTGDSFDYELLLRDSPGGTFYSDGTGYFTPNGLLSADLPLDAVDATIVLTEVQGLYDVTVNSYAVIGNEVVKVKSITLATNQITIARGCLDTVPEAHSGPDSGGANADRIWFAEISSFLASIEYTATDQPGVKILPRTPLGQLAEGDATARNADVFDSRVIRPYPPGDFKLNSVSYPSSFSGEATVSWKHRDRTQQLTSIIEHANTNIGPEAGTTYTLQIYGQADTLLRTETGLSGTSYTYDTLDELVDSGFGSGDPLNTKLRFVLKSVRGGYDSWQSFDITVART